MIIDGVVNGDIVRDQFVEYLNQLGDNGSLQPDAIADAFWTLHNQHRSAWTHEIDLRPFKETWSAAMRYAGIFGNVALAWHQCGALPSLWFQERNR